ncbi:MAG: GTPase Era [Rhodospirillales bacterium]|nr:GTPase Era [Rhodospirillales bacterium]
MADEPAADPDRAGQSAGRSGGRPSERLSGRLGRCGFVAVIGAPNAGKSTLVNAIVGAKVSIVTPKQQTTRFRVLGITSRGDTQIILVDTPGIFQPRKRLERAMVAAAWSGASDADEVVLVVDASRRIDGEPMRIVDRLKTAKRPAVLALNKIDLVAKPELLRITEVLSRTGAFSDVFMISALGGDGTADLVDRLARRLPEGPWLFPEDQISDLPERTFATEITREQLFLALGQELPYAVSVETESWSERADGSVEIRQIINVEREGQKGIVIGAKGGRLGRIGAGARSELERLLGCRVHLFLFVRVQGRWSEDPAYYRDLGLDYKA